MRLSEIATFRSSELACAMTFLTSGPITSGFGQGHHEPFVHPQCTFRATALEGP
jgi:hypothetical protein